MSSWQLKILTTTGTGFADWHKAFDNLDETNKDLHYLPEYIEIYQTTYGQKGFLAFYGDNEDYIMMPYMKRPINTLEWTKEFPSSGSAELADIVNAYGYGGPVARITHTDKTAEIYRQFFKVFSDYCVKEGIICEFASLHPLLRNHEPLNNYNIVQTLQRKKVVFFDLNKTEEQIWRGLSRGNQSSINKAKQKGVVVTRESVQGQALAEFKQLYAQTMERHNANSRWIFPDDYFQNCARYLGHENVSLFCAWLDEEIIAEYLVLHAYQTAYYHFGGSKAEFFDVRANNLLMYEIALWAKKQGFRWFHLGGGLQNEDSLHRFKTGFSKDDAWLYTYSRIFDQERYSYLCSMKDRWDEKTGLRTGDSEYFPAYRN